VVGACSLAVEAIVIRRLGYPVAGKSFRLGWWRFQRCPVGGHWSLVTPVRRTDLTPEEQRFADASKDIRIP
jgi:hypothetical protein